MKQSSDTSAVAVESCDTGTEAAVAEQAVKCNDDEDRSTSDVAELLPAAVVSEVHDSPSHATTDTDQQSASPAENTPVTSSEPDSTSASPTPSDHAEANSDSAVSLPTDADTNLPSTDPVPDGD